MNAFRQRRRRLRFAWLALFALLFQQAAMVAYACAPPEMSRPVPAEHCAAMNVEAGVPSPEICVRYCDPDSSNTPDLRPAGVPPLALPPPAAQFARLIAPPHHDQLPDAPRQAVDPPPTLRFCSLLI